MNGESFFDSFQEWHPPSPRSTPQSTKFGFYPFQSPVAPATSPLDTHHGWMTSQTPTNPPIAQNQQGQAAYSVVSPPPNSAQPKRQHHQSTAYSPPLSSGPQPHPVPVSPVDYPRSDLSSVSFVERFDSTTLEDPFTAQAGMAATTPAPQMRTPPPTRDDSTRRKPQQPRLAEFQTPSTIASRRMSAPSDAWHHHASNATPFPEPSPFTFTPMQFTPPPSHFGFPPSGPMTAPVYPQSGLFWDPNSNHAFNHFSFSTIAEEPFGVHPQSAVASFNFDPAHTGAHRFTSSDGLRAPLQTLQAMPRPHSARPADLKHGGSSSKSSVVSMASSVDPTMLLNTQNIDSSAFSRPESVPQTAIPEVRQPYQHQNEALRREKEERSRRAQKVLAPNTTDLQPGTAERSLRRSLTDSRARRSSQFSQMSAQGSFSDAGDPAFSTQSGFIPREGSPLKRLRPGSQQEQLTPTKARSRRSVVLTVDEQGNARTEVKAAAAAHTSSSLYRVSRSLDGDSDSSDLPETIAPRNPNVQSALGTSPPSSDAQDALREVVRNRKMKRPDFNRGAVQQEYSAFAGQPLYSSVPSSASKSQQPGGSSHSNNSPTTITDPEFHTPSRDRNVELSGSTRCICNGRVPEDRANLMIECESCKNWLHVACLGISPEHIPPVFVCWFCSSTPATRGGRIRPYSGAKFQAD